MNVICAQKFRLYAKWTITYDTSDTTATDGTHTITMVNGIDYHIVFNDPTLGFLPEYFGGTHPVNATVVATAPGVLLGPIDAQLTPVTLVGLTCNGGSGTDTATTCEIEKNIP